MSDDRNNGNQGQGQGNPSQDKPEGQDRGDTSNQPGPEKPSLLGPRLVTEGARERPEPKDQ